MWPRRLWNELAERFRAQLPGAPSPTVAAANAVRADAPLTVTRAGRGTRPSDTVPVALTLPRCQGGLI